MLIHIIIIFVGPDATLYFDSYDCASFVIRALNQLNRSGAQFLSNVHLNYTRLNIYAYEPQLIGTYEQVVGNETLRDDFIQFYREFDSKKPGSEAWVKAFLNIYETFFIHRRFYLYYNQVYWYMNLKRPKPIEITFDEVPISALLTKIMQ
jgi:ceroid-lipofuscinosis neuronal protein 5